MKPRSNEVVLAAVFGVVAVLVGCAPVVPVAVLPEAILPAPGETFAFETRATGVQIYQCAAGSGANDRPAWTFRAPEADLYDQTGRKIGRHFAGPTWEASDGSTVVGSVKAREDAPKADAIPWLLLAARSTGGAGRFAATSSIQRVDTAGGIAPSEPCSATMLGAVRRVPYTATYYFYRPAQTAM